MSKKNKKQQSDTKKLKKLQKVEKKKVNKIGFFPSSNLKKNEKIKSFKKNFKEKQNNLEQELLLKNRSKKLKNLSLRERMLCRLQAARFRFINEELYTNSSDKCQELFKKDPDAFKQYHKGYCQQITYWPINPLDIIIEDIKKKSKISVVADFGCGEARLADSVKQKVHSLDLVALKPCVIECDMAKSPLETQSIDIAVFCLSLMGTNVHDFLLEANRVLKLKGLLKIAEVETRFDGKIHEFISAVSNFGFKLLKKNVSNNLFYFFDFVKVNHVKNKKKLPRVTLLPCLYKKR